MAAATNGEQTKWPYQHRLSVSFPTPRSASMVYTTVAVDSELRPERVHRTIALQENTMHMSFAAADFQHLRVSVSSFMDILILATRTLATFNDSGADYRQPQPATPENSSHEG